MSLVLQKTGKKTFKKQTESLHRKMLKVDHWRILIVFFIKCWTYQIIYFYNKYLKIDCLLFFLISMPTTSKIYEAIKITEFSNIYVIL